GGKQKVIEVDGARGEFREQGFDGSLEVVKIGGFFAEGMASGSDGQGGALIYFLRQAAEDGSCLEERGVFHVAVEVEGDHRDHSRKKRGAEHSGFFAQWIAHCHDGVGLRSEKRGVGGGAEGGGDGLGPAHGEQGLTHRGFFRGPGKFDDGAGEGGQRVLEAVVAVDAGDFFDEVDFALEVESPAWERDLPGFVSARFQTAAKAGKEGFGGSGGDAFRVFSRAQNTAGFRYSKGDAGSLRRVLFCFGDDDIDKFADLMAAGFEKDLADESRSDGRGVKVGSALEAMRGVSMDEVAFGGATNAEGVEPGGFNEDIFGFGGDARIPSSHDSGKSEGLLFVGDHEVFGIEDAVDFV